MSVSNIGFTISRLIDIKESFKANFKALFPNANMSDETINGQINSLFADAFSDIYELAQDVYNSSDITAAEGYNLNKMAALAGINRKNETYGETSLLIYTATAGYTVASGYQAALDTNTDIIFETTTSTASSTNNEWDYLYFSAEPDSGSMTLIIDGTYTTASILSTAIAADIKDAINTAMGTTAVSSVSGGFSDKYFLVAFGDSESHVITINNSLTKAGSAISTRVDRYTYGGIYSIASALCLTAGPIEALEGAITTPITVDAGVTSVINWQDTIPGSHEETDAELRLRLTNIIGTSPSNTDSAIKRAVFALNETEGNASNIINFCHIRHNRSDSAIGTLPAHAFETTIYYPGATESTVPDLYMDARIAAAIYSALPAGIEPYGAIDVDVPFEFGGTIGIGFTRPSLVPIYLAVTITVDPLVFAAEGAEELKNAILIWGNSLGPGQDVVVHGYNSLESIISTVAGITDIAIDIDTSSPPTGAGDANIIIDDGSVAQVEISKWSSSAVSIIVA